MFPLVLGLIAGVVALALQPTAPPAADPFPPPTPLPIVRLVSLGRSHAGADVLWLRSVQMVGHPDADAARYPHLDEWIDQITELDPSFEYPYAFAAVLLSTDDRRLQRVDAILTRGESHNPDSYWYPLQRGFVAYFGMLDGPRAAEHYLRASSKAGAPPYLAKFAHKLLNTAESCAQMQHDLQVLASQQSRRDARAMEEKNLDILVHCIRASYKKAAAHYRLTGRGDPDIDKLVADGMLPPLPRVPGLCWRLDAAVLPALLPCSEAR